MGDVQNINVLQLTYGMYASNGRCKERSCLTVDVEDMSALRKMVRTPKLTKHSPETT